MASFSGLLTSLTDIGFYYQKESHHAVYNFNQDGLSLYRNNPRFPFEYYININLNNVGTAKSFIDENFNTAEWAQLQPLVKTVDMPAMKIETTPLNQYNRKRLSQTKIAYEPVKVVFHDVCDGKTLKFWDMYYRYYFKDGIEPGMNNAKQDPNQAQPFSIENLIHNITPQINPNILNLPSSITSLFQGDTSNITDSPTDTVGSKSDTQNIISDTLTNHHFGFNLEQVQNIRNLIKTIEIYQVHAGRFNQVTLVNPRISGFTHDTLNYAEGGKTLELTFTFEYEYAYYNIQNMKLGGGEQNNTSTIEQFSHGEILELPALAFNASIQDFIEGNNPLLQSDNPIIQRIGKNVQSALGTVTGSFLSNNLRRLSSSTLDGLAHISPTPYNVTGIAQNVTPVARSFASTAVSSAISSSGISQYIDVNRIGTGLFDG